MKNKKWQAKLAGLGIALFLTLFCARPALGAQPKSEQIKAVAIVNLQTFNMALEIYQNALDVVLYNSSRQILIPLFKAPPGLISIVTSHGTHLFFNISTNGLFPDPGILIFPIPVSIPVPTRNTRIPPAYPPEIPNPGPSAPSGGILIHDGSGGPPSPPGT